MNETQENQRVLSTERAGYLPYGEQWEKEMMKLSKKELIEMIRNIKTLKT